MKGSVLRATMPSRLRITRIADLNRGVYNSIVMHYKVNGELRPLTGHTLTLTVKPILWDDIADDSTATFVITGIIDPETPWRVLFPITAQQSYLDPEVEYFGDIVDVREDGIPVRKAIFSFMVNPAPTNSYSSNTLTDEAYGPTLCVNEGCDGVVCVDVTSGEKGDKGEKGDPGFAVEYNISNQINGVRTQFTVDPSITQAQPIAVYYGGQRFFSGADFTVDYNAHTLTILGAPLDAYEGRKLIVVVGSDPAINYDPVIYVDGTTVQGTGRAEDPLRSPRQGSKIDGPYATVADIPTPYSPAYIYLVGAASPYAEYVLDSNGDLVQIGSAAADLTNYYTKSQVDSAIANKTVVTDGVTITGNGTASDPLVATYVAPYVPTYQQPFVADYSGSQTFTLPKTPVIVGNVWVLPAGGGLNMLQTADYSISGADITISSPTLVTGDKIKVEYTA
jgi:hypothetical protein